MKVTLGDITVGFWKMYWWNSLLEMGINVNMYILPFKDLYVIIFFFERSLFEALLQSKMLICCSGNKPDYHVEKGCAA